MPELPEMQALAERLEEFLEGAEFTGVDPLGFSALKTVVPGPESLVGLHLRAVGRRGVEAWRELHGARPEAAAGYGSRSRERPGTSRGGARQ